jgi:hypothetical protein
VALGNQTRRRGCSDDTRVDATGAGGAVTGAVDEAAVGLDLDLKDGGVVGAREGVEGLAAAEALALVRGEVEDFLVGGKVVVVASAVALMAGLLAASAFGLGGWRVVVGGRVSGGRSVRRVMGLRLLAEEAVFEVSDLGLESCDFVLELGFALCGALMLGLVVAGLLSCVPEGGEERTGFTREQAVVRLKGRVQSEWRQGGRGVVG